MNTPQLNRHGGHFKPHYKPQTGQAEGQAGVSTDEARQDGDVSGIVKRFSKHESAGDTPIAMGWIKARYVGAIEYTGSPQGQRGILLLWGLFGAGIGFGFGFWRLEVELKSWPTLFIVFPPMLLAFGLYMILWTTRLELFRPEDEPTLFDRKHRKVYRVFRETQPGWRGLFKLWPLRATEYDWDLIDVEHQAVLTTTGSTVTRYHALLFLVKKSASDPTIIDSFTIGNTMELGELTVPAVWEHIRRFMEEHGPHLPPGESLAPSQPPKGFGQSLAAVGPFVASYRRWWQDNAGFMILIHVLFPVFVPFFLLWGFFNWLSYRTATRIEWPAEVRAAVGAKLG
jgi:hypothetical protein